MAGTWTSERFPQFEQSIRRLTDEHRELTDEPLHLAINYLPQNRNQQHLYLLEVIGGLGQGINPERDLFEVTFAASPEFPMAPNEELHLLLTNPAELEVALREGWPLAQEVVDAIRAGDYSVMHEDDVGRRDLAMLRELSYSDCQPRNEEGIESAALDFHLKSNPERWPYSEV